VGYVIPGFKGVNAARVGDTQHIGTPNAKVCLHLCLYRHMCVQVGFVIVGIMDAKVARMGDTWPLETHCPRFVSFALRCS
jgi:translation elongation factor EF-4